MKAQEKAKELYEKILYGFQHSIDEYTAKKCAIIAVDEIIKYTFDESNVDTYILKEYLCDVKQEIKKL